MLKKIIFSSCLALPLSVAYAADYQAEMPRTADTIRVTTSASTITLINAELPTSGARKGLRARKWLQNLQAFDATMKFSGYIIGQYSATDQKGAVSHSNFNLRLARLLVDGYVFKRMQYRVQLEINGAPGVDKGPRVIDAFMEWQPLPEARVKFGQFKRSFTFENPIAPLAVGFGTYSQFSNRLLLNDRVGEHNSGGRDLGVQLQGDLFPAKNGHRWLHYQVGVFNGQGINHSDKDNFKDLMGGIWISPVKNLRIGGFGWNGKYTNEAYNAENPLHLKSAKRIRWSAGIDYDSDWSFRGEYISSVGGVVTNAFASDRTDAWYAMLGAPVAKNVKCYVKWDCLRENKHWNSMKQIYGASVNWWATKKFLLQANYYLTDDRAGRDRYFNTLDLQAAVRF